MAKKKFLKLKSAMVEHDITQAEAAKRIGKGLTYLSERMTGKRSFSFNDARLLGQMLDIPKSEWADYFTDESA